MDNLNSVLIEGEVVSVVELSGDKSEAVFFIFIGSQKTIKENDSIRTEAYQFEVRTVNKGVLPGQLMSGQGVRVVGSLRQSQHGDRSRVFVMAEHIEFRP